MTGTKVPRPDAILGEFAHAVITSGEFEDDWRMI
jgi:hypothetical protein